MFRPMQFMSLLLCLQFAGVDAAFACHAPEFSEKEKQAIAVLTKKIQNLEAQKTASDELIDAKVELARVVIPLEHERALQLYMDAINVAGQIDKDNPRIAHIIHTMAKTTRFNSLYLDVAPANLVELEKRALAIDEKHFGAEHPETARSLYGLGIAYVLLDFQMYPGDAQRALSGTRAKAQFERYFNVFGKRGKEVDATEFYDALDMLGRIYAVEGDVDSIEALFFEKTNAGRDTYFLLISSIVSDAKDDATCVRIFNEAVSKTSPGDAAAFPSDLNLLLHATTYFISIGNKFAAVCAAEKAIAVAKASIYAQSWLEECHSNYELALKASGQTDKAKAIMRDASTPLRYSKFWTTNKHEQSK